MDRAASNKKQAQRQLMALAKEAIEVQDAVNLRALSRRFADVIAEIADILVYTTNFANTEDIWKHPVTVLWVNKFESLVRSEARFTEAYGRCIDWSEGRFDEAAPKT